MKTRSWIGRITFPAAVMMALTATLLTGAWPSVAQAATMSESSMRGVDAHHGGAGDHPWPSGGDHQGDWDHHSQHHFGGRPHGTYYVYPWVYRYYSVPTYAAPTYWYYCPSYAAYYPYVGSCPESWVLVPAS